MSAQSVGFAAFVTAGCMVAGGVIAQARARRRAHQLRKPPSETTPVEALTGGKRVLVAGRLRVDGSCCARLEDAMPVAATTFEQRNRDHGGDAVCWCDRARQLRIEVGDVSIRLFGSVRVLVGVDELYPACDFEQLRGRVSERILAAEMMAGDVDTPRYGVFRSVGHGDQVIVAGIVEPAPNDDGPASYRRPGGGWRLRPDESGMLLMWSRRRPRVRGAFGAIRAYAAAVVL